MKWIPIKDYTDLPRESGPVLVTYREPDEFIGPVDTVIFRATDWSFGKYDANGNWHEIENVIAWVPTPKPYEYVLEEWADD